MKEMNEKNKIDELFKQGLRESDIPFDEAHWRDMKKKLAQDGNRRRDIILWTSLGGAAAMLLMAMAWWFITPATPVKVNEISKKNSIENKSPEANAVAQSPANSAAINAPATGAITENTDTKNNFAGNINRLPATTSAVSKTASGTSTALQVVTATPQKQSVPLRQEPIENKSDENKPAVTESPVSNPAPENNLLAAQQNMKPAVKDDSSRTQVSVKGNSGFKPALVLSVTASPDLNAVNSFSNTRNGFNGGLLATVTLSRKLSVTSGAVLAKKVYETPFSNYKPGGTYVFPVTPYDVLADCRVIDIPFNLNYTFLKKGNTSLGFSTGASTYLMLTENYNFQYTNPAARSPKNYKVRSQNQHYFGVGNLALSYERKLNNNASLALQPFVKLPLTEIGNGNVKLLSAGVSVNFNINISNITGRKP